MASLNEVEGQARSIEQNYPTRFARGATAVFLVPAGATYYCNRGLMNSQTCVAYRCW